MSSIWEIAESRARSDSEEDDGLFSPVTHKLLALKSITSSAEIEKFLYPQLENLHDSYLIKGMKEAVRRILVAIDQKQLIMIHGDYDVDGVTGTALLARAFKKLNAKFIPFLPDRAKHGYGVSKQAIDFAKSKNVSLLVTVDCGITAIEEVSLANEYGIQTIIVDHHQIHGGKLPEAFCILNPLQEGCAYPFKELSACGLAFKLAQALIGNFAFSLLDLAALSSVCDVAPLVDENRIIVKHGLDLLSGRKNVGLSKLSSVAKLKARKINTGHIGFMLGPRINACGRMSSADTAFQLLTTDQESEAERLALALDDENKARQREERDVLKQAIAKVEREINFNRDQVIVVWSEGWHQGVIGIVAQRLVDKFGRPSVVIALENKKGKGSGRSVKGFHLFKAFEDAQDFLVEFGGHELAAGLSIDESQLEFFRSRINQFAAAVSREVFVKRFKVDLEVPFSELTPSFFRELEMFEPFGAGNPKPVFLTRNIETKINPVQATPTMLRWWVTDGVSTFEAVWNQRQGIERNPPDIGTSYEMIYSPSRKEKDGIETVLLEVKDVRIE